MRKYWENSVIERPINSAPGVPASVNFGALRIAPATILAPMAGVTDTVFRRFIRNASFLKGLPQGLKPAFIESPNGTAKAMPLQDEESGCGLIMTEFTSADGLFRCRESKRKRYLHFYQDEHPISAQLFGNDPEVIAGAAKVVRDRAITP